MYISLMRIVIHTDDGEEIEPEALENLVNVEENTQSKKKKTKKSKDNET